jgi:hypothetical protein
MAAPQTSLIAIGGAQVLLGPWAANKAGTTMTDVGHTKAPTVLSVSYQDYAIMSEQAFSALRKIPITASIKVKIPMLQSDAANVRIALRQPSSADSPPNQTTLMGIITEQYHRCQVVTKGISTTGGTIGTRTTTLWRIIVEGLADVMFGKTGETMLEITADVLYDDTVSTADKFLNIADSGGT